MTALIRSALVLIAIALVASFGVAKDIQWVFTDPTTKVVAVIPPCGCGCMESGSCTCKNCCERTGDPNAKPLAGVWAFGAPQAKTSVLPAVQTASDGQWVCTGGKCQWIPNASTTAQTLPWLPVGSTGFQGSVFQGSSDLTINSVGQRQGLFQRWRNRRGATSGGCATCGQ